MLKRLKLLCAPLALALLLTTLVEGRPAFSASIQPLQDETGRTICTTWSINQQDGLWATAAHCVLSADEGPAVKQVVEPRLLHGKPVVVVFYNAAQDLAVVRSPDSAPTMRMGDAPKIGDKISVFGFFWGGPTPTLFQGTVANLSLRNYMIYDMRGGPGHSGSPVTNALGEVVSVLQIGVAGMTGGATYESLTELLPYWGS